MFLKRRAYRDHTVAISNLQLRFDYGNEYRKDERRKKRSDIKPTFIIANTLPEPISKKISEAQQIQLDIIAKTNFNLFNGKRDCGVAEKKIVRCGVRSCCPWTLSRFEIWIVVIWHADTLYIYPEEGWQLKLEEVLREQFNADEVSWIGGSSAADMLGTSEVQDKSYVILEAWWD